MSVGSRYLSFVVLFAQSANSLFIFGEFATMCISDKTPKCHILCISSFFPVRAQEPGLGSGEQLHLFDFALGAGLPGAGVVENLV